MIFDNRTKTQVFSFHSQMSYRFKSITYILSNISDNATFIWYKILFTRWKRIKISFKFNFIWGLLENISVRKFQIFECLQKYKFPDWFYDWLNIHSMQNKWWNISRISSNINISINIRQTHHAHLRIIFFLVLYKSSCISFFFYNF